MNSKRAQLIPYILPLLNYERWRFQPYHVQLELMSFSMCFPEGAARDSLVDAITELLPRLNPMMGGMAVDTLGRLGAFDGQEANHMEAARLEVSTALNNADIDSAQVMAWRVYESCIDHPYSLAYVEAVEELSEIERRKFRRLACDGARSGDFFISSLMFEIAESGDELGIESILRWTHLPDKDSVAPQTAIEVFISSAVALARVNANLPDWLLKKQVDAESDALVAYALLYYCKEQEGMGCDADSTLIEFAAGVLSRHQDRCAMGVLYELSRSICEINGSMSAFVARYSELLIPGCRAAAGNPVGQHGYFALRFLCGESEISSFCANLLGAFGTVNDLPILRALVEDASVTDSVVKAIRAIECRFQ